MVYDISNPSQLLDYGISDFSASLFRYMFAHRGKLGPRFIPQDTFIIPKGRYYGNTEPIKTNIGRFMLNKAIIPENIYVHIGFFNERWTSKSVGKLNSSISSKLLDAIISPKDVIVYLDKLQFYGFSINSTANPSMTDKTVFLPDSFYKKKEQLAKENKVAIEAGDTVVTNKMEKELLSYAKEIIGNDPGMDLFDSGAKASFDNNFKLLNVMKGSIMDLSTGQYKTSTTHYMGGVKKEESHLFADSMVAGAYARGVGTQIGGYLVKKYMAAFQSVILDEKGSACNTVRTMSILLTKDNIDLFKFRNIKEGSKVVELTPEIQSKYIGRKVEMYDPMYCINDKICNRCAGQLYYKLNIQNIGLTASKISSLIMQKSLKKFHDNTLKIYDIQDVDDLTI